MSIFKIILDLVARQILYALKFFTNFKKNIFSVSHPLCDVKSF